MIRQLPSCFLSHLTSPNLISPNLIYPNLTSSYLTPPHLISPLLIVFLFFYHEINKSTNRNNHDEQVKLIVNMIMGTMMSAFSEGLALGKATDIPLETLMQVLDLGAMSNPMFRGKGPLMVADKFPTNFPLKHQQKDMRLALELAEAKGVALPTSAAANANFVKAMAEPLGAADEDFSAVLKAI